MIDSCRSDTFLYGIGTESIISRDVHGTNQCEACREREKPPKFACASISWTLARGIRVSIEKRIALIRLVFVPIGWNRFPDESNSHLSLPIGRSR